MWVVMTIFVVALLWSVIGEVDIVAVAPGRIVVSDRTKVIQPLESGVVRAIHVRDGDRVKAGQVLIELDPTSATADRRSVAEQLQAAASNARRSETLLSALASGRLASGAGGDAQLHAEWADIAARTARLDAELLRKDAELGTVRQTIEKLQAMLPLARQREADIRSLAAQGFVAGHSGQDRTRERIELERDLATQQAREREAKASLAESRQSKAAHAAETRRALSDRLAKAKLEVAQLEQQGAKTTQREQLATLKAPVDGTVQQLAVHSIGGVVTPAQALMVVVPEGADVTAEVVIDNKDIGFVHEGQIAEIKLETFSFTRYDTVTASVRLVTADAVNDEQRGAIFPATLALDRSTINVDGKRIRLSPGMNVTAEIKTGKRRVIEYLLAPVQRVVAESLGER